MNQAGSAFGGNAKTLTAVGNFTGYISHLLAWHGRRERERTRSALLVDKPFIRIVQPQMKKICHRLPSLPHVMGKNLSGLIS